MDAPQRKIIHIDCDCFYAAIEMRDDPSLAGIPLAVGGRPDARGVIATCNYIARRYGVHSAMASATAIKRCPTLKIIPPDMARYRAASQQIMEIYRDYTELIEPLSLDEAYLDVTASPHHKGSATRIAEEIRARIRAEVGITASAGVAPNKFLAKVASDWNKPDGLCVIRPQDVAAFVATLPVAKIHGVGRVTAERLAALGINSCADLAAWPLDKLAEQFGRFGERLYQMARGIDHRPVETERPRKSLSVEETFVHDLPDLAACHAELPALLTQLAERWQRAGSPPFKQLTVKIKFADFTQTTAEHLGHRLDAEGYATLLDVAWARGARPVRLLGVGVRMSEDGQVQPEQLTLFGSGG
ncbi:DNA polymerase IV [Crenobacter sp. SG2305]|uniref:DNA polymerase IV n=1 Tax=Crenobacter oryzisoli TaxID=3056844 RepID=UPI0025AB273E|nr:DNA polymerase IV [Crenobacter sp. SG2305]MDN0081215.1 DNA polymerase IV [Crenobacter sp. SG2305]